jgi:hypothetical protein
VVDEAGIEHKFFSPTSLSEKKLSEKWDEIELVETTEVEKQKMAKILNLNIKETLKAEGWV